MHFNGHTPNQKASFGTCATRQATSMYSPSTAIGNECPGPRQRLLGMGDFLLLTNENLTKTHQCHEIPSILPCCWPYAPRVADSTPVASMKPRTTVP